jgi:hypothetical protein
MNEQELKRQISDKQMDTHLQIAKIQAGWTKPELKVGGPDKNLHMGLENVLTKLCRLVCFQR